MILIDFDVDLSKLSPSTASPSVSLQVHTTCFYAIAWKYQICYINYNRKKSHHFPYFPFYTFAWKYHCKTETVGEWNLLHILWPFQTWVSLSPKSLGILHIFAFQSQPIFQKRIWHTKVDAVVVSQNFSLSKGDELVQGDRQIFDTACAFKCTGVLPLKGSPDCQKLINFSLVGDVGITHLYIGKCECPSKLQPETRTWKI